MLSLLSVCQFVHCTTVSAPTEHDLQLDVLLGDRGADAFSAFCSEPPSRSTPNSDYDDAPDNFSFRCYHTSRMLLLSVLFFLVFSSRVAGFDVQPIRLGLFFPGITARCRRRSNCAPHIPTASRSSSLPPHSLLYGKNNESEGSNLQTTDTSGNDGDMNLLTKSSWYAVEWFGKAFGRATDGSPMPPPSTTTTAVGTAGSVDTSQPPTSLRETMERIRIDNDRAYFLSGDMDVQIYDEDCLFADPFVSFRGRDRFVENLANLGSFIIQYDVKILNANDEKKRKEEDDDDDDRTTTSVSTRFMVKLKLNLPWKPILAWPWGVTYEIDPDSNLVIRHEESWEIEPWEGVKQIFRKPTLTL